MPATPPEEDRDHWPWESDDDDPSDTPLTKRQMPDQRKSQEQPGSSNQKQQDVSANEAFIQAMLQAHNRYRAAHQVPPLTLREDLTRAAQAWADALAEQDRMNMDAECKMQNIGENIALSHHVNFSGSDFTDGWYTGIKDFDYANQSPKLKRGSMVLAFTQMVWKATKAVGFGRAVSRRGRVYAVGRYYPRGNLIQGFAENVPPPEKKQATTSVQQQSKHTDAPSDSSPSDQGMQGQTIGPVNPSDTLISAKKAIAYGKGKSIVTVEETYSAEDGSTYTRKRTVTYPRGR